MLMAGGGVCRQAQFKSNVLQKLPPLTFSSQDAQGGEYQAYHEILLSQSIQSFHLPHSHILDSSAQHNVCS
jgi:hypothetical protein